MARLEDGARARRGQLHGAQAGEPDAVVDPQVRRADRGHRPGRRDQHRQRPGRRDRQGAGDQQADREDRLHRRDRDRAADHAVRRAEPHPVDDRARRQVAEHLLRRRDGAGRRVPRQGRRGARALRLQQGRGLHLPVARADPRVDLRRVHGALPAADRRDPPGPPARPGDDARAAGLDVADGEDRALLPDRARGGRRAADRRPAGPSSAASWTAATTSSRPSSRATTRCGSSRRRSSARCSR